MVFAGLYLVAATFSLFLRIETVNRAIVELDDGEEEEIDDGLLLLSLCKSVLPALPTKDGLMEEDEAVPELEPERPIVTDRGIFFGRTPSTGGDAYRFSWLEGSCTNALVMNVTKYMGKGYGKEKMLFLYSRCIRINITCTFKCQFQTYFKL